ncbi:MAG: hypothetical protein RQ748_01425 [Elusimicrobiales bacterium]|nr:hypothetical protein [Elusimicrobiales bacterium]
MDFFKLRVLNTFLFLLLGASLGYLLSRGAGVPALPEVPVPQAMRQPADEIFDPETPSFAAADVPSDEAGEEADGEYELEVPPEETRPERSAAAGPAPAVTDDDDFVIRGKAAVFFRDPSKFAGAELEMELQMITARRLTGGWRLNFLHSGAGRQLDYIYIDDDRVLGETPDLRIGYFYRVRFKCRKGGLSSGNSLVSLKPTGGKASWATGISAVE